MGRTEKRELVSRLALLPLHPLKWQHQPSWRGSSWTRSIANSRDQLADHLADNPSLKARIPEAIATAYRDAATETGLDEAGFPIECPWSFDQIMDADFWPDAGGH